MVHTQSSTRRVAQPGRSLLILVGHEPLHASNVAAMFSLICVCGVCTCLCTYVRTHYTKKPRQPDGEPDPWPAFFVSQAGSVELRALPVKGPSRALPEQTSWFRVLRGGISMSDRIAVNVLACSLCVGSFTNLQVLLLMYAALSVGAHFLVENPLQSLAGSLVPGQRNPTFVMVA